MENNIPFQSKEWKSFLAASLFTENEIKDFFSQSITVFNPELQNKVKEKILENIFGFKSVKNISEFLSLQIQKGRPQVLVDIFFPGSKCYPERKLDGSLPLNGNNRMSSTHVSYWVIKIENKDTFNLDLINFYCYSYFKFRYEFLTKSYITINNSLLINNHKQKLSIKYY